MLGDLGKFIAAKGFIKLPKVQKIARSGHTAKKAFVKCVTQASNWGCAIRFDKKVISNFWGII